MTKRKKLVPEEAEPTEEQVEHEQRGKGRLQAIPAIAYYEKSYGHSLEGNDRKGIQIFKTYETLEQVRRIQRDLQNVKDGKVAEHVCDSIIGKKRRAKYTSYQKWAGYMLIWLTAKR